MVSIEPYAANSSDLSPVIFRLKKADPDVIVAVSYAQDAILLGRQAAEFKLNKPFIGTGGGHSLQSFQKALGDKANGVFNVDFTQYEVNTKFTPGLTEFLELYRKTFKRGAPLRSQPDQLHGRQRGLRHHREDRWQASIRTRSAKAAMAVDIPLGKTANGWGVKFDDKGQNTRASAFVTQWRDGKLLTVFPKGAAVVEPVLPVKK